MEYIQELSKDIRIKPSSFWKWNKFWKDRGLGSCSATPITCFCITFLVQIINNFSLKMMQISETVQRLIAWCCRPFQLSSMRGFKNCPNTNYEYVFMCTFPSSEDGTHLERMEDSGTVREPLEHWKILHEEGIRRILQKLQCVGQTWVLTVQIQRFYMRSELGDLNSCLQKLQWTRPECW